MKKFSLYYLKVFLTSIIPIGLAFAVAYLRGSNGDWPNIIAGIICFSFITSLLFILGKMLFETSFREEFLSKIFGFKNADEREEIISGIAAKKGQLFLISLTCMLLFISIFKLSLKIPTVVERNQGKHGVLSVSFGLSLIDQKSIEKNQSEFKFNELPLSKEGIILLMLIMQLLVYHFYFREKMSQ